MGGPGNFNVLSKGRAVDLIVSEQHEKISEGPSGLEANSSLRENCQRMLSRTRPSLRRVHEFSGNETAQNLLNLAPCYEDRAAAHREA